jgi:hypothetical protein
MASKVKRQKGKGKSVQKQLTYIQKRKARRVAVSSIFAAWLLTFFFLLQIATIKISNSDFPTGNIIPTQDADTESWKTYAENRFGFSFQYPDQLFTVMDDTEVLRTPTPANPEELVDLRDNFFETKGYDAPHPLYALRITNDENINPFSIWIFDNKDTLSPDAWYEKYDYYPFAFGTHIPAPVDAERPIQNVLIHDTLGKYHLRVSNNGGETAYMYIQRGNRMVLLIMNTSVTDGDFGNKILSTVRFSSPFVQ